jgi:hypothetical protein
MKIKIFHWNNDLLGIEDRLIEQGHEVVDDYKEADVVVLWNEIKHS